MSSSKPLEIRQAVSDSERTLFIKSVNSITAASKSHPETWNKRPSLGQCLRIGLSLTLKLLLSLSLIFDRRRHYLARPAVVRGLKRLNPKGLRGRDSAKAALICC